jgi:hypothetical protein
MNSLFTHRDDIEGKVGVGKLPIELQSVLDDISKEYYDIIPDKNASTHHTWYDDMPSSIKSKVEQIQSNEFWNKICDGSKKCVKVNVKEMDELYYSNFKKTSNNVLSQNLYGATGNIVIHKDCHHVCSFNNAKLYRIIIGLSDNNDNIVTKLTELDIETKINKNDYIIFDFSRTTHQVIKENQLVQTPRILLKLHFIVCETNNCSNDYLKLLKRYFINYDIITRYLLKTGTDPKTFYQFFIGLICQHFYMPYIQYIVLFIIGIIVIILKFAFNVKLIYKNLLKIIKYVSISLIIMYLGIVIFYWLRYTLFGIK